MILWFLIYDILLKDQSYQENLRYLLKLFKELDRFITEYWIYFQSEMLQLTPVW
jgi:hypothetical protein